MISKNLVVETLDLGKMDSRSNITVTSLTVGGVTMGNSGVTSGSNSFTITPNNGGTSNVVTLTGELGRGTLSVQQTTTAAGCTCGVAPT